MQNADNEASTSKATKEEDQQQEKQELQQEEQEEQSPTKIKTRSRFSAAFRSLSSKKPSKDLPKQQKPRSAEQLAEDLNSSESVPKRQSLTRRLLLGSLRPKTKARPHSDELSLRSSSGSRERGLGGNTLQITISGKKVETLTKGKAKPSKSKSQRTSAVSETDYLNPTPAETAAAAAATGATAATAAASVKTTTTTLTTKDTTSRTTKLIVAKVSAQQQLKKKRQQQQQLREATEAPQTEEKIVITESTRDTPPRERAPAKPSRASATNNQLASSSTAVCIASTSSKVSQSSRKERALMQQQQQRGHRLTTAKHALQTQTSPQPEPEPEPETESPTTPPPPLPAGSPPEISLSDVDQQADAVSLAESAQTTSNQDTVAAAPVVRFAVGSAVRSPVDTYEAALAAAAASTQQPSSSEEPSDSSLRRLSFKQQQPQFALSDHDSIEGRRETLRYQSVASEYSNEEDTQSEEEHQQQSKPMPAFGDLTMDQQMEPTIMSPSGEKREHLYKILVIGELGTGKTSFIKRYVHQFFSQNYRATIGVDFALKVLHWDANTIVRLQLWDIAGQERFGNMTRVYYKEAVGAFIVFDVTRSGTFDCVSKWKEDLDSKVQLPDGSPIPCILLANKCDQEKQGIVTQPERMDEYVRENGFAGWFETSAKENINIDEAARALVNKILINDKLITADANDAEKFNLSAADASADAKNKCSC
ncbi:mediator of RNA polymerase II transcription subunit 15 isoform X1 [Drosophila novamexicana]|uniref:mediator of RNA polymerase II transcription subunit 15 isoform X1 n=1 Tax=Drosophila novamexicana TaxID=47314 RepID=UPI0011E5BE2E|nr:mediator of RNA polymerase II transcription subunit 15 isoform X1 [Drosophila novamexicana]